MNCFLQGSKSTKFSPNISNLFIFSLLFGFIGRGLQFKQQQEEGVTIMSKEKMSNGITNLADVVCGRQLKRRPKIVGGTDAAQGEFPWLVSIKEQDPYDTTSEFSHFCGGIILNKRHVLSAAHCFAEKYINNGIDATLLNQLRVTIGEHDLSEIETPLNAIDVGVEKVTIHPAFDTRRYLHDIAILRLDQDIEWTKYAWPACLVNQQFQLSSDFGDETGGAKQNATVAGWGSLADITGDTPGVFPNTLQKTTVPILSNAECQKWFHHKTVQWSPKETHLCAGYSQGGFDSCRGDSGGPLMIETDSTNQNLAVIGIVAAGKGCARPYLPGVYTRVAKYVDWITQNTK